MKVLIDTNVLIDVLAQRRPFYNESAEIWTKAEAGQIEGMVSAVSFTNIFYIVRKLSGSETARDALRMLRDVFTIVGCDRSVLNPAIESPIKDFEDAVQYFSAAYAGAECLISRNVDDFPRNETMPVLTPNEFLAAGLF